MEVLIIGWLRICSWQQAIGSVPIDFILSKINVCFLLLLYTGKADSDESHECLPDLFIQPPSVQLVSCASWPICHPNICALFSKGLNHTGEKLSFTLKSSSCKISKILRLYQGTELNGLILQKYVLLFHSGIYQEIAVFLVYILQPDSAILKSESWQALTKFPHHLCFLKMIFLMEKTSFQWFESWTLGSWYSQKTE